MQARVRGSIKRKRKRATGVLTQARVRELFDYRDDGKLIWKIKVKAVCVGDIAGGDNNNSYTQIGIDGKPYLSHRVIWLWHHGYIPEHELDHINRKPWDNRIENLREVTHSCNLRNSGNRKDTTSGVKGVYWHAKGKKWQAQIKVAGMAIGLGLHKDFIEAVCHRLAGEQALNWAGCDSSSPAYQYVREQLKKGGQNE